MVGCLPHEITKLLHLRGASRPERLCPILMIFRNTCPMPAYEEPDTVAMALNEIGKGGK